MSEVAKTAGTIGFIGRGTIGAPVARRPLAAGHSFVVTDISTTGAHA